MEYEMVINPLTVFTWGYYGWGNSTAQLIKAVDAIEHSREFAQPMFVDIRIRRAGRAPVVLDCHASFWRRRNPAPRWAGMLREESTEPAVYLFYDPDASIAEYREKARELTQEWGLESIAK
jgi:hypothetical protein